mmetsp:Transcript_22704/g.22546  ORF Transcript_22704/g.22546 Transcript_22704/m.22546 type:complete len:249 (+) Transcript_22704:936-1682(+)
MVSKKNSYPSEAVLDIGNTRSIDFVDKVIKDVLEMFEPEILHLGGDKPNIGCLNHISDPVESLRKYIEKEREILKKYSSDTRAMYWFEDGSFRYNPTDILHYKGNSRQFEYTISSHRENYYVFSPSDIMVVHHGYPDNAGTHRNTGRTESWKRYWDFNPASYNKNGKMLGSEVLVWTEMMNEFEFLPKTFPRAGIVSFKHWNSTPSITSGAVIETIMRLQYRLKSFGVPTEKISMRYCEEHTHHCFGL